MGTHYDRTIKMTRRSFITLVMVPFVGLGDLLQRMMDQMWLDAEARHFAAWIKAEEQRILYGTGEGMPMGLLDLRRPWPLK